MEPLVWYGACETHSQILLQTNDSGNECGTELRWERPVRRPPPEQGRDDNQRTFLKCGKQNQQDLVNNWEYTVRGKKKPKLCLKSRYRWTVMISIKIESCRVEDGLSTFRNVGYRPLNPETCASVPRCQLKKGLSRQPQLVPINLLTAHLPNIQIMVDGKGSN
jgi:hypothetical protein